MGPARLLPAVALAAGLFACGNSAAQPVANPAPASFLPVVPASVGAFVTLKVSDLARHPDLKPVLAQLAKQPDALGGISEVIGVSPLELDRITLFWPQFGRDATDPILVVTTAEPFNEARVLKSLRARPVPDDFRRFRAGDWGAATRPPTAEAAPAVKTAEPKPAEPGAAPAPKLIEPPSGAPGKSDGDLSLCTAHLSTDAADPLFYALEGGPFAALFLIDERTLVFLPGRGDAERAALTLLGASLKKNATGPLADALADASKHTFAAGVYLPPLFRELDRRVDPELVPYTALLAARTAVLTGDLDKGAKFNLALKFDAPTAATRAAPVLEEGLANVAVWTDRQAVEMRDSRRPFDVAAAPVLSAFAAGLKKATVKADGTVVLAAAEVDFGPATAQALGDLLQAVQSRRKAALRMHNLKHLGLALHMYHDANQQLPANVYGPKGEVLLSWRVQLLPYLEEDALYRQFKMDEPWDSENNKKLIEKMPKVFQAPDRDHGKGKTFYQAFVERDKVVPVKGAFGRPWLKGGEKQGLTFSAFTDGLSNTLAVVEAGEGVVWSKPDDLPFGGAVPLLGEKGWDRTPALLFDGSVRLFPTNLKPDVFWPHVTINGGEVLPDLDDRRGPFGARPLAAPPVVASQAEPVAKAPVPAKEPEPLPPPKGDGGPARIALLEARASALRAQANAAAAQSEAAAAVLVRLERLAEKGIAVEAEVARARAVFVESQVRVDAIRREVAEAEAQLKAARTKALPGK